MPLSRLSRLCLALMMVIGSGCVASTKSFRAHTASSECASTQPSPTPNNLSSLSTADQITAPAAAAPLTTVSYDEPSTTTNQGINPSSSPAEFSPQQLVEEVQARNPNLESLAAAWRAAVARYPQAISLDDPMFMAMVAPASFGSDEVDTGYTLQGSQKFPWFGKRAARGWRATAAANAARFDLEDARLQLEEMTLAAYYDYYLVRRQLELNVENLDVLRQFHDTAQSRYRTNQVTQQDVLQADVELANLELRRIELDQLDRVAQARINVLLRVDPTAPLPAPPKALEPPRTTLDQAGLQQLALSQRPDLAALRARVREEQAAVALACKDYYPDTEVFGRYDAMWQERPLQPAVGVNLNVPIYRNRLNAALREAQFSLSQRGAELDQRVLDIQYEVAAAYQRLDASRQMLDLYDRRLIPAAEQNRNAARSNYDVSKSSYFELAAAQRQLITLREEREQTLAEYHTRLAELNRAVGGSATAQNGNGELPPVNNN